jgi:hypothetical protein
MKATLNCGGDKIHAKASNQHKIPTANAEFLTQTGKDLFINTALWLSLNQNSARVPRD